MNHIFFRPIGDNKTASSRLRVWNIQPHIKDSVIGIADEYRKGDVLIIQKVPDINELRKAKSQGAKVIYDIDDLYYKENHVYEDWKLFSQMIKEADLVTVDSEEKKKDLPDAVVIPDSLDWDGTTTKGVNNGVIGWTGYGNNSVYLNDIIDKLPKDLNIRLITDNSWVQFIKPPAYNVQSRPWSLEKVDTYLAECEMGLYYLPDREFENVKGEHKLLKNWAIGIPTYTSPMPAYVSTMEKAGVGDKYIVKDWSKLKNIGFDEKCRKYAMKFKSEEVAKIWKKLLENLLKH